MSAQELAAVSHSIFKEGAANTAFVEPQATQHIQCQATISNRLSRTSGLTPVNAQGALVYVVVAMQSTCYAAMPTHTRHSVCVTIFVRLHRQ